MIMSCGPEWTIECLPYTCNVARFKFEIQHASVKSCNKSYLGISLANDFTIVSWNEWSIMWSRVRPIEAGLGIPPEDVTFPAFPRTWSRTGNHLYLSQARRMSTLTYIFLCLYLCLAPGYKVDSPIAALSTELVQALFRYIVLLYVNYNYPY